MTPDYALPVIRVFWTVMDVAVIVDGGENEKSKRKIPEVEKGISPQEMAEKI